MRMKTRLPAAADRQPPAAADGPPSTGTGLLITAEGIATYLACHRAWWLAEAIGHAPGEELAAARASLARRRALAQRLAVAGGALIGLAVLLVGLGVLIG